MTAKVIGGSQTMNEAATVQAPTVGRRRRSLRQLDDHKIAGSGTTTAEKSADYVSLRNRTISKSSSSSSDLEEPEAEPTAAIVGSYCNWLIGPFVSADISTLTGICRETVCRLASLFQFPSVDHILFSGFVVEDDTHDDDFHSSSSRQNVLGRLRLPWEVRCVGEEEYQEDHELKEKIQGLSFDDDNFLKPFPVPALSAGEGALNLGQCLGGRKYYNAPGTFCFVLDESHTQLACHIMQFDPQLQATRERLLDLMPTTIPTGTVSSLSGKIVIQSGRDARETAFWKNYFYHCNETRISHLALYEDVRDETQYIPRSAAATCIAGSSWWLPGCPGLALLTSPTADEQEEVEFKRFQPAFPSQIVPILSRR
jgi:hypothetical protein